MKTVSLSGSSRKSVGKKGATELRNQDRIPAVLYGGKEQVHFSISENEAKKLIFTPNVYLIDLEVNGKKVKAIIQETQIHPVTDRILHIDFFEVNESNPFKVKLPVTLSGFSRGVRNGGRLRQNFRKLHVMGLVGDMPDDINIDITPLRIGHKKRVSDLAISGLKFLDPSNAVVVGVQTARAAVEDEEEEGTEGAEGAEASAEGDSAGSEEGAKE
jgi:large subunit ribosomal protein L25